MSDDTTRRSRDEQTDDTDEADEGRNEMMGFRFSDDETDPSDTASSGTLEPGADGAAQSPVDGPAPTDEVDGPVPSDEADSLDVDTSDTRDDAEPLGDLAQQVQDRRHGRETADDDIFEEMETAEVDTDDLWKQVFAADDLTEVGTSPVGGGEAVTVEREDAEDPELDHIVAKADYCEQCEYFSSPPTVACTHEGSDVVEVVDSEHFRVRNCPVIEGETAFETVREESDDEGAE